ncbi:GumC family protein [Neoaquamicrobium sediminum]|uniref:GumC family protein n=1 Tax=Neoaquamicrobium sediminum TaxID=1849104 RepID=UPI001567526C|nr:exopolysaccharide transport family protein [Mesorhizobium sediminum]NRC54777.1 chain-length determining protein [Mesorhizobium sediminum]
MSEVRPAVSDVDVDLAQLFGSLLRNWLRILVVAVVVAAGAFLLMSMATPLYRAETRILIESRESVYTRPSTGNADADRPLLDEEGIASQVEVISSADILRDVARKLDLASLEEFGGTGQRSTLGNLLVLVGLRSDASQAPTEERVLQAMNEKLVVYRVERSRVIVVQFSSEDPKLAAAVPNAIADAYIAVQEAAKRASNSEATDWLEPEIADLRQRVREAEARVADYRATADLMVVGQGNSLLATQQLSELSTELSRVRANRSAAEGRASAIRAALDSGERVDTVADVLNAPLVQRLRERQVQIEADLANLSASLLNNHPRIRALNAQLAETDQQLRQEVQKVLASLETEVSTAQAREQQLIADLNTLKAESARAGEDEVELRALEREATAQRALLESYLTRYREAASRADRNYLPADARIFSRATPPFKAYFPKPLPIMIAAFVATILVVAVVLMLRELFSGRAMRPATGSFEPVEQVVMPVVEPELSDEAEAETAEEVMDEDAPEEVRAERPADELSIDAAADRLVASGAVRAIFVSPEGDEAAATSVMVARAVCDAGLRVLFLDLTASGAPSSSMLESSRYPGITNLLASEAQFADVIRGDLYSDCHVIPVGTADAEKAMRAADRLPIIMASLTTAYDMVVVECGPTNAHGISRVVDDGAEVLVSVIEPEDEAVADIAADLAANGYEHVHMVTPVGHILPPAPEGRSAA